MWEIRLLQMYLLEAFLVCVSHSCFLINVPSACSASAVPGIGSERSKKKRKDANQKQDPISVQQYSREREKKKKNWLKEKELKLSPLYPRDHGINRIVSR